MKRMFALFVALLLILPMIPTVSADGEIYYVGGDGSNLTEEQKANGAATFADLNSKLQTATGVITIEVVGDGAGDFTVDFSGFDSLTVDGKGKTIGSVSLTASGANKKAVTFRDITVEKKHRGYCPL